MYQRARTFVATILEASTRTGKTSYRPDVDGLRAVAVVAVIIYHFWPDALPSGFLGVDIFFVISGFVITGTIQRDADKTRFSITQFYIRRFKRILPALITVLLATLAFSWFFIADYFLLLLSRQIVAASAFLANIYFWFTVGYFSPFALDRPLLHLWSLGVEEQFYLFWPLLMAATLSWRARNVLLLMLALAGLSYLYSAFYSIKDPVTAFYSPLSRIWQLGLGGMVAYADRQGWKLPLRSISAPTGTLLIAIALFGGVRGAPAFGGAMVALGTALVVHAETRGLVHRALAWRPATALGLISYPLYLWHWPLLSFAYLRNARMMPSNEVRVVLLAAAMALSLFTYLVIEQRLRRAAAARLVLILSGVTALATAAPFAAQQVLRPVDSEPAQQLVAQITAQRQTGLDQAYRQECNFSAPDDTRGQIDPVCLQRGSRGTVLLWGDSYAQALSLGLREHLPKGYALSQVATSGCAPRVPAGSRRLLADNTDEECRRSNEAALAAVRSLHPRMVVLSQRGEHEKVDWEAMSKIILFNGAGSVVVVGPPPRWKPSLHSLVARYAPNLPARTSRGLEAAVFTTDAAMKARSGTSYHYISLLDQLCDGTGCKATDGGELMAVDAGHLSLAGSRYVGTILTPRLFPSEPGTRAPGKQP